MNQFSIDDLYLLSDCVRNMIQDNQDYCESDEQYDDTQQSLSALLSKVEAQITQSNTQDAA